MTVSLSAVGALPAELRELRLRVRAFLEAEVARGAFRPAADAWMSGVDIGFSRRLAELKGHETDQVVVHCKSGGRSMQFTQILRQQGFKNVKSMAGGILLWNKDVNPGGPQY